MQPDSRLAKVRALLDSDNAGERAAARAAVDRLSQKIEAETPLKGSPAWNAALREFRHKIGFCSVNRSSPVLSREEQRTIANFVRYGGSPFNRGAHALESIYSRLKGAADGD